MPITLNLSKYCRLEGGHILPGEPALCAMPTTLIPDQTSCYSGPNSSFWVTGTGCVGNLVNSCVSGPTFHGWEWSGDDVVCHYLYSSDMCAGRRSMGMKTAGPGAGPAAGPAPPIAEPVPAD